MDDFRLIPNFEQTNEVLMFREFPTGCLPPKMQSFVRQAAKALQVDECFVALPLLSLASVCVGNKAHLKLKDSWKEPPILWTCLVGKSGSGKSPALRAVRSLVDGIRERWKSEFDRNVELFELASANHQAELAEWVKQKKRGQELDAPVAPIEPTQHRLITNHATIEGLAKLLQDNPNGLLLDMDELAELVADRYANKQSQQWLQLHNGDDLTHDRKVSESLSVRKPFLSIMGGIQTARLHDIFNREQKNSGLAARFLFAMPPARVRRLTDDDIAGSALNQMRSQLEAILKLESEDCALVEVSAEAKAMFKTYYDETQDHLMAADDDVNAALSKLVGAPLRLSLVLLFGHHANALSLGLTVDEELMGNAIELAQWFAFEAARVYGLADQSPEMELMGLVLEVLAAKQPSPLSVRDLMRSNSRLNKLPATTVEKACLALGKAERIFSTKMGTTKPKIVYRLQE